MSRPVNDVTDRSVVVTGGGSGYGLAMARRLAAAGAAVTIADIADGIDEIAAGIESSRHAVRAATCDVSRAHEVEQVLDTTIQEVGALDAVVNNAGVVAGGWIHEADADEQMRRNLDVNLVGVWNGCRAALARMRPHRRGVIINTASPGGVHPTPGSVAYGMAKAAVIHLTRSLAVGYGRDGVRVNAILPGPALTGIFQADPERAAALERAYRARIPLGRVADVGDLAAAVQYLISDDASFVSGAVLNVDGAFCPAVLPEDRE
jgi:NAD(P)-dependent dehydrogenase (short-subunit alcohol dehydrogenase family)